MVAEERIELPWTQVMSLVGANNRSASTLEWNRTTFKHRMKMLPDHLASKV